MLSALAGPHLPGHGLGGAQDLPVPASLAVGGGVAALLVSFVVLAVAWRRPRYDPPRPGRPAPDRVRRTVDAGWWRLGLRLLGLLAAAWVTWALVAGRDLLTNPAFGVFYVLVWVGLVPASLLAGRVVRAVSPVRTVSLGLARLLGTDAEEGLVAYPRWLGCWPAALGLLAFAWQELVDPAETSLGSVQLWLAAYAAVMLLGAAVFGVTWLEHADPFEVYGDLVARLSPWGRDERGTLVLRSPLANLATTPPRAGLLAVVAVLFGSTAYDSFRDQLGWYHFVSSHQEHALLLGHLALFGSCLVVGLTFWLACAATPAADVRRRELPHRLAHSLVPIVVGYITAHYLSFFVEQGQVTLQQLSDPLSRGQDLLGTGGLSPQLWLSLHPGLLAVVKVLAVVTGHVVGVVAAHDRALRLLPERHRVSGQLALVVVMMAYTGTGLWLLFGS